MSPAKDKRARHRPASQTDEEYLVRIARRHAESVESTPGRSSPDRPAAGDQPAPAGRADASPPQPPPAENEPIEPGQAAAPLPDRLPRRLPARPAARVRRRQLAPPWRLLIQILLVAAITAIVVGVRLLMRGD